MEGFPMPWGNYVLKQFIETNAPDAVSMLPQTMGWLYLSVAILAFITYKLYKRWKMYKINVYRREAISWLNTLSVDSDEHKRIKAKELPALLKKVATHAYPQSQVQSLHLQTWENG